VASNACAVSAVILLGGDSVHPDLEKACLEAGVGFIHTYGMTETASHIALRPAGAAGFRLLEGVEAGIDPEDGHLFIDLQDFPDLGRLHTRDAAEWLPDGSLRIIGRLDHVINSGGVKIAPEPAEAALQASGLITWQGVCAHWRSGCRTRAALYLAGARCSFMSRSGRASRKSVKPCSATVRPRRSISRLRGRSATMAN
jgi:acyl-CoA synthetase (AMP-forming)/AMP-acid ligase II